MAAPNPQLALRLAREGRWWDTLAVCRSLSRVIDPDVVLAEATACAALGLRTLAVEALDRLCAAFPAAERREDVLELRSSALALPDDRVPETTLIGRVERAASALDLGEAAESWRRAFAGSRVFVASDGNAVRQRTSGELELAGDHRAAARAFIGQYGDTLRASAAPILIEGVDPPWLALAVCAATRSGGYSPGIRIVQAEPVELLDGLSLTDGDELLDAARVEWFIGSDVADRLRRAIEAEPGVAHEGPAVPLATLRTPVGPALGGAMRAALAGHARSHESAMSAVRARDDASSEAERLGRLADPDRRAPLRIALIAGRFTTVLRPMVLDLAAALERRGCVTRVITEPNDHRRLTPQAYSVAFAEFEPDLVVAANHTRDDLDRLLGEPVMPRSVPWVTWVQDAMPHLLRPEAGSAIGPLDLAFGHVTAAMLGRFGYPESRVLRAPMAASEDKFSPDLVDPALAAEFACEVAAFTNHSETPTQMRARLIDEVSASPGAAGLIERIADAVDRLAQREPAGVLPRAACAEIVDSLAPGADQPTRHNLIENVALRLYDRILRHRTLGWARSICQQRGWRLSIFGGGWEAHPTLAASARGELSHGRELCSAYAAAGLTLSVSSFGALHQRVAECALAGGLPAVLVSGTSCQTARRVLRYRLLQRARQQGPAPTNGQERHVLPVYRCEVARRFDALRALEGGRSLPYIVLDAAKTREPEPHVISEEEALGLFELGFWSEQTLEARIAAATDDAWRAEQSARVAAFVRERCTHDALAGMLLDRYAGLASRSAAAA